MDYIIDNLSAYWTLILILVLLPLLKYISKKHAEFNLKKSPNEAPAKVRKLELTAKTQPFSGWLLGTEKGKFVVKSDGIGCGNYLINLAAIQTAELYYAADNPMGSDTVNILRIKTAECIYDFSVSALYLEKMKLPFNYEKVETKLLSSKINWAIALLVILLVLITLCFIK